MVKVKRQIVPANIAKNVTYADKNPVNYITVHQTGNPGKGANAKAHAKLQSNGNSRAASWHYTVDDKEAYQSFEDTAQCWHCSDGQGPGNTQSIGVEICINSDGDYKKAVANGAKLVKQLLDKHNLSIDRVKQHHDWYPKNCPAQIRAGKDGITWSDFINMVKGVKVSKPKKTQTGSEQITKPKANLSVDGKWGDSTTLALQKALGTPQDGIISKQPRNSATQSLYGNTVQFGNGGSNVIVALQKKIGAGTDGKLGPGTIRSLQKYLGTPVDGVLSRPSIVVKEMQRRLNAGTF
ncbi:peptidoglycan recognition protein family protein [Oceanobacillus neutriphilus]|uniref:N-acetylmuramoyl-L-alanine amidase n=1 Tax=Oceanobacillus neutriphilus TaxID=531815 RepID=A0ABQ2P2D7_9BACI|nr:N-acetylmuramoyl-L-alanine amidase [Oceanobacillus neutriphilus]GGP16460.1 N-acetylmuramoyl-L-alanine amidase CwlH [Oceanobacillus neutriphilus]